MSDVVYDTAVLIAADRNDRAAWADHRIRLELGIVPLVPAGVVAQASRSSRQVQLRRLLRGCNVVPLDERSAHEAGRLLGISGTSDVVDASLVALAAPRRAVVVTDDPDDIGSLGAAARADLAVMPARSKRR